MKIFKNLTVFFSALCISSVSFANTDPNEERRIPISNGSSGVYAMFSPPIISNYALRSKDLEITFPDKSTKTLSDAAVWFNFVCSGSHCSAPRIKDFSVFDYETDNLYVLNDGDIADFSFNDARACFGYTELQKANVTIYLSHNDIDIAQITKGDRDSHVTECADVALTKDSYFRVHGDGSSGDFSDLTIRSNSERHDPWSPW